MDNASLTQNSAISSPWNQNASDEDLIAPGQGETKSNSSLNGPTFSSSLFPAGMPVQDRVRAKLFQSQEDQDNASDAAGMAFAKQDLAKAMDKVNSVRQDFGSFGSPAISDYKPGGMEDWLKGLSGDRSNNSPSLLPLGPTSNKSAMADFQAGLSGATYMSKANASPQGGIPNNQPAGNGDWLQGLLGASPQNNVSPTSPNNNFFGNSLLPGNPSPEATGKSWLPDPVTAGITPSQGTPPVDLPEWMKKDPNQSWLEGLVNNPPQTSWAEGNQAGTQPTPADPQSPPDYNAIIANLQKQLANKAPEQQTQISPNLGESIAGLIGSLAHPRRGLETWNDISGIAAARQQREFQNANNQFQLNRQTTLGELMDAYQRRQEQDRQSHNLQSLTAQGEIQKAIQERGLSAALEMENLRRQPLTPPGQTQPGQGQPEGDPGSTVDPAQLHNARASWLQSGNPNLAKAARSAALAGDYVNAVVAKAKNNGYRNNAEKLAAADWALSQTRQAIADANMAKINLSRSPYSGTKYTPGEVDSQLSALQNQQAQIMSTLPSAAAAIAEFNKKVSEGTATQAMFDRLSRVYGVRR